ncbi:hypothetical protein F2Q68_00020547 [Brassica cretica]|uniref:Uncharacterized protein n=1 Tax=Brassica cretica TaxID=69181 RepID=A0A8S9FX04_BRACR|nr:hypothetical protein F2Q68_00020547 [Brassica cretica]
MLTLCCGVGVDDIRNGSDRCLVCVIKYVSVNVLGFIIGLETREMGQDRIGPLTLQSPPNAQIAVSSSHHHFDDIDAFFLLLPLRSEN